MIPITRMFWCFRFQMYRDRCQWACLTIRIWNFYLSWLALDLRQVRSAQEYAYHTLEITLGQVILGSGYDTLGHPNPFIKGPQITTTLQRWACGLERKPHGFSIIQGVPIFGPFGWTNSQPQWALRSTADQTPNVYLIIHLVFYVVIPL